MKNVTKIVLKLSYLLFVFNLFVFSVFITMNLKLSADNSELQIDVGEIDNDYFDKVKDYKFSPESIDYKTLYSSLSVAFDPDDYVIQKITYNVYGEAQYLLFDSLNTNKYMIFDFMINEIAEYSLMNNSPFITYQDYDIIYAGPGAYYYLTEENIVNIFYSYEVPREEFDLSIPEHFELMDDLTAFQNRVFYDEKIINNGYYFEYFHMPEVYNRYGSCVIVALSFILTYLDTYKDDNLVPDLMSSLDYIVPNYPMNVNYSNSTFYSIERYDSFLFDQESIVLGYHNDVLGASKTFHDYLLNLAVDKGRATAYNNPDGTCNHISGLNALNTIYLLNDYITENNITYNLQSTYFTWDNLYTNTYNETIKSTLYNNNPIMIAIKNYGYYIGDYYVPVRTTDEDYAHDTVAYGYQSTSYGDFYITHFGWMNFSKCYVNETYVYRYVKITSTATHNCSSNYSFLSSDGTTVFSMCPCNTFTYYAEYWQSDTNFDYFKLRSNNAILQMRHTYSWHSSNSDTVHTNRCCFYGYCYKEYVEAHDYVPYGNDNPNNHYHKCTICNYSYHDNWSISNLYYDDEHHSIFCNDCNTIFDIVNHNYQYSGNHSSHTKYCSQCPYVASTTHDVDIEYVSNNYHEYICSCGYQESELHSFDNDLICTVCDYQHVSHFYLNYQSMNSRKHTGTCLCGDIIIENHTMIHSGIGERCTKCNFYTDDFIYIEELIYPTNLNILLTSKKIYTERR